MQDKTNCEIVWYEKKLPFVIWCQTKRTGRKYPSHWHPDMELSLLFEGEMEVQKDGKCIKYREGDVCLLNSREIHSIIPNMENVKKKYQGITILIRSDFLHSMIDDFDNIYFRLEEIREKQEIAALMYRIFDLYSAQKHEGTNLQVLGYICEIINILCEKCMYRLEDIDIRQRRDWEKIRMIIEYICNNYNMPLQQQEVAQMFYFSRGYFASFFKKYTGKTFKEYLTEIRMNEGESMLLGTSESIARIAQDTGFGDERRFIETFKRYYGMTPGNYRKKNKME